MVFNEIDQARTLFDDFKLPVACTRLEHWFTQMKNEKELKIINANFYSLVIQKELKISDLPVSRLSENSGTGQLLTST